MQNVMKKIKGFYISIFIFSLAFLFSAFIRNENYNQQLNLPYKQAGLTQKQAAAHLLSRFTYGAKPGDVEDVLKIGLEKWLLQQLDGKLNDQELIYECYVNLGTSLVGLGNYEKALEYHQKSLLQIKEIKDENYRPLLQAQTLNNIGFVKSLFYFVYNTQFSSTV